MNAAIKLDTGRQCIVRILPPELTKLGRHLRKRYPDREWGTLMRCGFRRTTWGLAVSVADLLLPEPGEMDRTSPIFVARSHYLGRAKQECDSTGLACAIVHSHPQGGYTYPSSLDDEMDLYGASLFGERPYISLIFSWTATGEMLFSGRAYDRGRWMPVVTVLSPGDSLERYHSQLLPDRTDSTDTAAPAATQERRNERWHGLLGSTSARRLAVRSVGIVGCSGTGSPEVELAVRAGFRRIVAVDPERLSRSNLERMHGSEDADVRSDHAPLYKVEVMDRMAEVIDPGVEIVPIVGNILDDEVLDHLLTCDVVINSTDTFHSRAFLAHLGSHYLVPCLDVGVAMEGVNGKITTQRIEITRFWPGDPCAYCRGKIVPAFLSWELMTDGERQCREAEAKEAAAAGRPADMYWGGRPAQLHTVGYLTTIAGSLALAYALGPATGGFVMPHSRLQFDIGQPQFAFAPYVDEQRNPECICGANLGWADAARHLRAVARPTHWPKPIVIRRPRKG